MSIKNTGWTTASTIAVETSVGVAGFNNLDNARVEDATACSYAGGFSTQSYYALVTNFGFSIPADAGITGIAVRNKASSQTVILAYETYVRIYTGSSFEGDNDAQYSYSNGSLNWYTHDYGANFMWGFAKDYITPAMVNSSSFGFGVASWMPAHTSSFLETGFAHDSLQMKIYYNDSDIRNMFLTFP